MTYRSACALTAIWLTAGAVALAQPAPPVIAALKAGGLVLVMRHAHAPQQPPAPEDAAPGNTTIERQLDARGAKDAAAIGQGLRAFAIPIRAVLVSPAFRARQTATQVGFADAAATPELGDNAQSMAGVTEAQARWLRGQVATPVATGNLLLITHAPNLTRAFPDWGGSVAEGEIVVVRPGADGGTVLARVLPDQW